MLSVVDNGPGIPRELLPHLFDSRQEHADGLGLGMSATIIREHGGQIMAESEEGRGAAFFVRLPRAVATSPTAPSVPPPRQAPSPPEGTGRSGCWSRTTSRRCGWRSPSSWVVAATR